MAQTLEHKTKLKIKKIFDSRGATYCMPASGYGGTRGISDFIACHEGYFISVEAKGGKGKASALQMIWLEKVEMAGGIALVVNEENLSELENILDRLTMKAEMGVK